MAVDIATVCKLSSENQSSQQLAIWLSILFSVYTIVSIALSALTIYTSSQVGPPPPPMGKPVQPVLCDGYMGADDHEGPDGIPLIAIPGSR